MTETSAQTIVHDGTFIPVAAKAGKASAVAGLLTGAAALVRQTEPLTLQWLALQQGEGNFAIVDFFAGPEGRAAHFAGQVAAALKAAAGDNLEGGWDRGVVTNVENSAVLASTVTSKPGARATLATRIDLQAQPGKADALAAFLKAGAALVQATEPGTLLWYALRLDDSRFAIFDVFESEAGRAAHFGGQVAAALKGKAADLVKGGWDAGVLANVRHYTVLSATF